MHYIWRILSTFSFLFDQQFSIEEIYNVTGLLDKTASQRLKI